MVRRKKINELENKTFEELLTELEATVQLLENSEVCLEESINLFSKSMQLVKLAGDKLEIAEQNIEQIMLNAKGEIEYSTFVEESIK